MHGMRKKPKANMVILDADNESRRKSSGHRMWRGNASASRASLEGFCPQQSAIPNAPFPDAKNRVTVAQTRPDESVFEGQEGDRLC